MKKLLSLLLSLLMVISIITTVPLTASAASTDVLKFTLTEDGKSYYVSSCDSNTSGTVVIPSKYKGKPVTSIGDFAFSYCDYLTSIKIPDSVTSIGDSAFYECESLKSITIPDSVTSIERYAFHECTSLKSISIPDSVTSIGNSAFSYCESLKLITIPDSVEYIGEWAFYKTAYYNDKNNWDNGVLYINNHLIAANKYDDVNYKYVGNISGDYAIRNGTKIIADFAFNGCTELTSVTIPDSVTSIGDSAFYECESLKLITIPADVTSIGDSAFYGCESLKSITIPAGVTSIGSSVFYECESLKSITIPAGVTSIGSSAFYECESLTSITIPAGVTSIGSSAFYECESLKLITIPDSVEYIGEWAFYKTAYYNDKNNWDNGVLYINNHLIAANKYDNVNYKYVGNISGDYVIRNGTKTIAGYAFANCEDLTSIKIPDSVVDIGACTFRNCSSLKSLAIGNGISNIGYYVFSNCTSLETIALPESVTNIGDGAFSECTNLKSIIIPEGTKQINYHSFYKCTSLKTITIPGSVERIVDYAFSQCEGIETIIICKGVTDIGDYSFKGCTNLKSLTLSNTVKKIGYSAFSGAPKLKSVVIPKSVTSIWNSAFGYYYDSEKEDFVKVSGFTIYGIKGTTAETYAKENGFKFIEIKKPTQPTLKKVSNIDGYVKVTWATVKGADLYRVYRMVSGGEYEYIGSTTNTYFNDKKAPAGKTCRYKIKAKNEAGYSEYSASIAIRHIDEPTLKSIENSAYGVLIKWDKVTGAEKYNVYRKVSGGEYKYIGATSKTYYTDKTAKSGTKYYYAIRAKRDDSISSQSASLSKYYLADPTLNTPTSTTSGIKLSWSKVTGAEGYMVYRKTGSGSYSKIATVKGSTKVTYTDKSAKKGKKYYYKVKVYKSSTYSAYSNTKAITDKY